MLFSAFVLLKRPSHLKHNTEMWYSHINKNASQRRTLKNWVRWHWCSWRDVKPAGTPRNAVVILPTSRSKNANCSSARSSGELWGIHWTSVVTSILDAEYCLQSKNPTWWPLTVSEYVPQSWSMCGCSQCPWLLLLFLKNTKQRYSQHNNTLS